MSQNRAVSWEGFFNARDLGGLVTVDGQRTHRARVYRSATLRFVTREGWAAARSAGRRTIVSLLNDDEAVSEGAAPGVVPAGITQVRVPVDSIEDTELWTYIATERIRRHAPVLQAAARAPSRARCRCGSSHRAGRTGRRPVPLPSGPRPDGDGGRVASRTRRRYPRGDR